MKPVPYRELEDELSLLKGWAAQAEAALGRIRQRHRRLTHTRGDGSTYDYCAECIDHPTYPCATIKDLAPK